MHLPLPMPYPGKISTHPFHPMILKANQRPTPCKETHVLFQDKFLSLKSPTAAKEKKNPEKQTKNI
jgi:hypothetical protein